MRLRRFVRASRIEELSKEAAPDLLSAIKALTPAQLKKYLRKFMPMDLVALIQKENPNVFAEAIKGLIYSGISGQNKIWMEWLNLEPSDVVNLVYTKLMKNDQSGRGILNEISLDGSVSSKYKHLPDINLKDSMSEDHYGLLTPHCPTDNAVGKKHPLWFLYVEGDQLEMQSGLDNQGRCISHEKVQGELSPDQQMMIDQGHRSLEDQDGQKVLRCTFTTGKEQKKTSNKGLNNLSNLISYQITSGISEEIRKVRKEVGQNVNFKKYERREELRKKQKEQKLSTEEERELQGLEKYYRETQVFFSKGTVSLDQQVDGDEGDGRSLHETISSEPNDIEVLDYEDLFKTISRQEAEFLAQVSGKRSLRPIFEKQKLLDMTPNSQSERRNSLEQQIKQEINKTVHSLFFEKTDKTCNTCQNILKEEEQTCSYASEMINALQQLAGKTEDITEIAQRLQKDQRISAHFQGANIESKISSMSGEHEVSEDDFDFGGFGDEVEESSDNNKTLREKLSDLTFDAQERQAYTGSNISNPDQEVKEEDVEKVQKYFNHLSELLDRVFEDEAGEELINFLIEYGVA